MIEVEDHGLSVDTEEDLKRVEEFLNAFIDITHNNNVNFDKFKHYHDISQETKDCFEYISKKSKPYLVTLQDCIDVGLYVLIHKDMAHTN